MRERIEPPERLLQLARRQGWVVTRSQTREFGMTRHPVERQIAAGHWCRLTEGVFYVQSGAPDWTAYAWAGVLLGGPRSRIAGTAAAHLHGLTKAQPEVIQILIPEQSRRADRDRWQFVRERESVRMRSIGAPPRTIIEDTVLDLCDHLDEAAILDLVTRAVSSRRMTTDMLRFLLARRTYARHRAFLGAILAEVAEGAHSRLELAYLRDVERGHRLPRGRRQDRRERSVRDVVYDEFATVTELDGRLGHEGSGRFRDMDRDNRAALAGEQTLRFGWHDVVGDPCRVAAMVAAVLRLRGWQGQLTPCSRCGGAAAASTGGSGLEYGTRSSSRGRPAAR